MKLTVVVEADELGVKCSANIDVPDMNQTDLNLYAIGAIEIAKASLLARRWGVNIGNFQAEPLIKNKPAKAARRKKA